MIYYLSCTGNTLWAARAISEAIQEPLINIAALPDGEPLCAPQENERIGFCFPVHGWRPPVMVRAFVQRLRTVAAGKHYCWALCTAGDDIGETIDILADDLRHCGLTLDSAFSLQMPESYVGLPFMDTDPPEKEEKKKRQAAEDLHRYTEMISQRLCGVRQLHLSHWPRINSRVLGAAFKRWLLTDRPFKVDKDRCTGCGRCASSCPAGNIAMTDHLPEWQHNGRCLSCFACYHHCPVRAIEYGHRTQHKGQYYFEKRTKH